MQYGEDCIAFARDRDSNGNQLKLVVNGYLVDTTDSIWRTANNERIELYTQIPVIRKTGEIRANKPVTEVVESDEWEWVPYEDRFDENGKIRNLLDLRYKYMITKEE